MRKARALNQTQIRGALDKVETEERLFRTLADHAPTMLWLTDAEGSLIYFNKRWLDFTGLPIEQVLSDGWVSCLHPDDRERCLTFGLENIDQRRPFQMEYRLRNHAGSYFDMLVIAEPLHDTGGIFTGYVGCTVDISTQKSHEQALSITNLALQSRSRDIGLLNQLNDNLQVCRNIEETKPILKRYGKQLFPQISVTMSLYNESRNLVEPFVSWGATPEIDHVFAPNDCWALRKSKAHYESGQCDEIICPNFAACAGKRYLCVPMMAYGEVIGNLYLGLHDAPQASDEVPNEDLRLLASMASDQIALALANLKLRATLQHQSTRDPLTQLYNRRYLLEAFERELSRSLRSKKSVALLALDIDNFKRYNDSNGHDAGDHVLREFGAMLRQTIRGSDIACRYGGEEFVLLLPDSSPVGAERRAEDLRRKTAAMALDFRGQQLGQITVSIGVACFPDHADSAEGVLAVADAALYRAKGQGRNCVALAARESDSPPTLTEVPRSAA